MKRHTLKQLIRHACDFALLIDRRKPDALRIAHEKRAMQRRLRSEGCSRTEANHRVWEHFRNRG